jgi:hypothetical protein
MTISESVSTRDTEVTILNLSPSCISRRIALPFIEIIYTYYFETDTSNIIIDPRRFTLERSIYSEALSWFDGG